PNPRPRPQLLRQSRRPVDWHQQRAAGEILRRLPGWDAFCLQQHVWPVRAARCRLRHGHREARRGFRPDARALGRGRRSLHRAADPQLELGARHGWVGGRRLRRRSGGLLPAHRAAQFGVRAAPGEPARRPPRREQDPRAGRARQVRVPARRLPAAPAQPGLRWQPAARAAAARRGAGEGAIEGAIDGACKRACESAVNPGGVGALITLMKTILSGILGGLLAAFLASAQAQELPPDVLVKNVTTEVVELITKDKEIRSGSRAKLIQVIEAKVLPHFNFASMAALAMGQKWNKATPEQKKRLVEEFRTLLVRTCASALAAYSEQRFDFRPLRARPTDTDVVVNVRVIQSGAQP